MTKKSNAAKKTTKKAAPAANANTPAPKKGGQTKLPGTGRLDANDAVEAQAELVRQKQEARMELEIEERAERATLTELLKKHNLKEYIYEDDDGEMRRAFVPKSDKEPQAKVQKLKKAISEAD